MALTKKQLAEARRCTGDIELQAFTASPSTIGPFDPPARLAWRISAPRPCPGLQFLLNGQQVSQIGTQEVRPTATTIYALEAMMDGVRRSLGSATVEVNTLGCLIGAVLEDEVRKKVRADIDEFDQATPQIRQRAKPAVELAATGLTVRGRFTIVINDFPDPNLDVDCEIRLRAEDGRVRARYRSFAVDFDWPFWVTGISSGVSKIVEEVIESKIEGVLRPRILEAVVAAFHDDLDMLPAGFRLYTLTTVADQIHWMACPA